jgi:predicted DNA-binding transcriptional regulator AlpA
VETKPKMKENLNRSWVAAHRWSYRATDERPTYGRNPKTKAEKIDAKGMQNFYKAVKNGLLPKPDGRIGRDPVWKDSTIDAYIASMNGNESTASAPTEAATATAQQPTRKRRRGRPALATRIERKTEAASHA